MVETRAHGSWLSGSGFSTGSRELFLNFHGVGEPPPAIDQGERNYWWDERPFLLCLDKIAVEAVDLPAAVFITFDDGNASDLEIAVPALLKRELTASFFVCAGRVGARGYLDAQGIRELLAAGMRLGSHGMHHLDWRKLGEPELHAEVVDAKSRLEDICGTSIDEVGIPFGSYDRRVLAKLRAAGYHCAYTSGGGTVSSRAWLKPRNTLDRSWQLKNVVAELGGREFFIGQARRALAQRYKELL